MFMTPRIASPVLILLFALVPGLLGCQGYELRGWVVEGEFSDIEIVDRADPRLEEMQAAPNVEVALSRDPGSLGEEIIARTRSNSHGEFRMSVAAFGAGWMDERWRIQAAGHGYRNADVVLRLPSNPDRRRILITLPAGTPQPIQQRPDLTEEFERYR